MTRTWSLIRLRILQAINTGISDRMISFALGSMTRSKIYTGNPDAEMAGFVRGGMVSTMLCVSNDHSHMAQCLPHLNRPNRPNITIITRLVAAKRETARALEAVANREREAEDSILSCCASRSLDDGWMWSLLYTSPSQESQGDCSWKTSLVEFLNCHCPLQYNI